MEDHRVECFGSGVAGIWVRVRSSLLSVYSTRLHCARHSDEGFTHSPAVAPPQRVFHHPSMDREKASMDPRKDKKSHHGSTEKVEYIAPIQFGTLFENSWRTRNNTSFRNEWKLNAEGWKQPFLRDEPEIKPGKVKSLYDLYRDPVNQSFKNRDFNRTLANRAANCGHAVEAESYNDKADKFHEEGVKLQEQAFDNLFKDRNGMYFDSFDVTLYLWAFTANEAITLLKKYLYRCSRVRAVKCLIVVTEDCKLETVQRVNKLFKEESIIAGQGSTHVSTVIQFNGRRKFKFLEDPDFQDLILREMKAPGIKLGDRLEQLRNAMFGSRVEKRSTRMRNFAVTQKARSKTIEHLVGINVVNSMRETIQEFRDMWKDLSEQASKCLETRHYDDCGRYQFEASICEEIADVEEKLLMSRILDLKHKKKWEVATVDLHFLHKNEGLIVVKDYLFQCSNIYAICSLKMITGWGSGQSPMTSKAITECVISQEVAEKRIAVLKEEVALLMSDENMKPSRCWPDSTNPGRVTFDFNGRNQFWFLEDPLYQEYVLNEMVH